MKPLSVFLAVVALGLSLPSARAQFPSYPAADRVLGIANFTTYGTETNTPSGMSFPGGLAIDPATGKLFVTCNSQNRILRFGNVTSLANGANAESVFGQVNFSSVGSGSTAARLSSPYGIHVDSSGRLWVADSNNNRVLMFEGASTLGLGPTADLVLGQPNFTVVTAGNTASKLSSPQTVFVDDSDNLWVADFGNSRVLKFPNVSTLTNGAAATVALGQPDLTTNTAGTSAVKMNSPVGVTVDDEGRLWISDNGNQRVLRYDNADALASGAPANAVLGQPDFTSNGSNSTAQTFNGPSGLVVDPSGTLYVADYFNRRVLFFKNPEVKANGAAADGVIGQPDFVTNTSGITERKMAGCYLGLVFDASGALWIADSSNSRVLRFSPDRFAATPATSGKVPKTTSSSKVTLKGSAADPNGIAQVRFRVGKGAFQAASGTTTWKFSAKLKPGNNTIEIVAVDTVGNVSAAKRVKVTRE